MKLNNIKEKFIEIYGENSDLFCFHSPGRINLIGEHTDYNGGYVLPCALNLGTHGVVGKRNDNILNFASTNFDLKVTCTLEDLSYKKEHDWANYLKGVVIEFQKLDKQLGGLDILISGDIPDGSGLSSSASIQILMALILNNLFDCEMDNIELAKLSQRAENDYIGVKSGIMDQYSIAMGKKNNGILLNCNTLEHEYIPINMENIEILIGNTNYKRKLSESKYNERRAECEKALEYLNTLLKIDTLSSMSIEDFENYKYLITDYNVLKRATHVIYENYRTLEAAEYLRIGDLTEFGMSMALSHNSLRDMYEVTNYELDTLVEEALESEGIIGARMTGAGFGGCTINIVEKNYIDQFIERVENNYKRKIGYSPSFYRVKISDGARQL